MAEFILVRSKETGLEFLVTEIELNDTVEIIDTPNPSPVPASNATIRGTQAGNTGKNEEGSK